MLLSQATPRKNKLFSRSSSVIRVAWPQQTQDRSSSDLPTVRNVAHSTTRLKRRKTVFFHTPEHQQGARKAAIFSTLAGISPPTTLLTGNPNSLFRDSTIILRFSRGHYRYAGLAQGPHCRGWLYQVPSTSIHVSVSTVVISSFMLKPRYVTTTSTLHTPKSSALSHRTSPSSAVFHILRPA
jgi:hypothetical protein